MSETMALAHQVFGEDDEPLKASKLSSLRQVFSKHCVGYIMFPVPVTGNDHFSGCTGTSLLDHPL